MKKLLIAAILLVAVAAKGEDFVFSPDSPHVNGGVSLNWWQDGLVFNWTNTAVLPWNPESIVVFDNANETNTITLQAIRIYGAREYVKASEVVTNIFGELETNVYTQVTNATYRVSTTDVYSATITGNVFTAITPVFNFKADDLLRVKQSFTNSGTGFILNGKR